MQCKLYIALTFKRKTNICAANTSVQTVFILSVILFSQSISVLLVYFYFLSSFIFPQSISIISVYLYYLSLYFLSLFIFPQSISILSALKRFF